MIDTIYRLTENDHLTAKQRLLDYVDHFYFTRQEESALVELLKNPVAVDDAREILLKCDRYRKANVVDLVNLLKHLVAGDAAKEILLSWARIDCHEEVELALFDCLKDPEVSDAAKEILLVHTENTEFSADLAVLLNMLKDPSTIEAAKEILCKAFPDNPLSSDSEVILVNLLKDPVASCAAKEIIPVYVENWGLEANAKRELRLLKMAPETADIAEQILASL